MVGRGIGSEAAEASACQVHHSVGSRIYWFQDLRPTFPVAGQESREVPSSFLRKFKSTGSAKNLSRPRIVIFLLIHCFAGSRFPTQDVMSRT